MADTSQLQKDFDGVKAVIRILAEHIGMAADTRRQISVHLGDQPAAPPPPPADPRDLALADMQRQLADLIAKQGAPAMSDPTSTPEPTPVPESEPEPEPVAEPEPEPEPASEPVNPQILEG